ncbi:MAG: DUF2520 domain-containing protein [Chitinophagaceae bacterium]
MQIVIIGTGNTATVLGKQLKMAGHFIVQVYGRNPEAAARLAGELQAAYCSGWTNITQQAELYIIALSDQALTGGEVQLQLKNQLLVHTAGSVAMEVLKNNSSVYGVFYPLQTLKKGIEPVPAIPVLIDGSSADARASLLSLAKTITQTVSIANDAERMKYHLCAVMTNNFSNYLYILAENYCQKNGLNFSNLLPLIDETANRLHHFSPRMVQTGPAIRKDIGTIEQHSNILDSDPELKKIYQFFTESMLRFPW